MTSSLKAVWQSHLMARIFSNCSRCGILSAGGCRPITCPESENPMTTEYDAREAELRKALDDCIAACGASDLQLILPISRLAQHLKRNGRAPETVELYSRGLRILEEHYGPADVSVALFAGYLAAAHAASGSEAEAAASLHVATSLLDGFHPQDPVGVASAFCLLGDDFIQIARHEEAALLLTVALRHLPGQDDDDARWRIWFSLGRMFLAQNDLAAAIACGKRSINVLQRMRKDVVEQSENALNVFTGEVAGVYAWLGAMLFDAMRIAELQEVEAMQQEPACFAMMQLTDDEKQRLEDFFARTGASN